MSQDGPVSRGRLLVSTTPALLLLLAVIANSSAVLVYSQLSSLGERWFPGYNRELRLEPTAPDCDPADYAAKAAAAPAGGDDLDALLDDDGAGAERPPAPGDDLDALLDDDEAEEAPAKAEGDDLDALLEDDGGGGQPAAPAGGADLDALLEDDDADAAEGGGDDLDALLDDGGGAEKPDPAAAAAQAMAAAKARCEQRHADYASIVERRTPSVLRFRAVEAFVEDVRDLGLAYQRHLLLLLLLVCGATATATRGHIALRPAQSRVDHVAAEGAQLLTHLLLAHSVWAHRGIDEASGVANPHPELFTIWIVGALLMAAFNVYHLVRPPADATPGGNPAQALFAVPLYCTMGIISGLYFLISEGHPAGLSIYLTKLTEFARLYLQVGLYVWIGMLLKRTLLAELSVDLVRPWKLPPELLAFVMVVGAAVPTAYSGASGIFVIAVGAVIYDELRQAGARRQLALAATAMSGSLGVVLSPCLLVVIVASLNKQVTTDQLYGWGLKVFLLTAVLFLVASLLNRQNKFQLAAPGEAMKGTLAAVRPLVPYVLVAGAVLVFYAYGLDATVDENYAPVVLPVLLLAVLVYDRRLARARASAEEAVVGFNASVQRATTETSHHIGALLFLMGLSICLGGVIERADLMAYFPQQFASVWTTMGLLVVVLVIVGMIMDPYGAVILVSATIAEVAYRNGIDPVHFWMVVLVAFELGYLTPPVALNHLLTRQVVGEDEARLAFAEQGSFWHRHERILLPVSVMTTALVIVAFGPLLF